MQFFKTDAGFSTGRRGLKRAGAWARALSSPAQRLRADGSERGLARGAGGLERMATLGGLVDAGLERVQRRPQAEGAFHHLGALAGVVVVHGGEDVPCGMSVGGSAYPLVQAEDAERGGDGALLLQLL